MRISILSIILGIVFAATGIIPARAESTLSLTAQADSAYNDLAYARALELYTEAADSLGLSSDLCYNIGNTYYRLNDLGHAILWYERALRLDPTNEDASTNLEFVNARIADRPTDDRSMIARVYDDVTESAHHDTWAWISFALFAVTVIAFTLYLIVSNVIVKKICFFGGGVLLIVTIFALALSLTGASRATDTDTAVITSPAAQLSTAPRAATDAGSQAFLLHEGTKVEIVDSVMPAGDNADAWYEVRVGNARAWVNGRDIERI